MYPGGMPRATSMIRLLDRKAEEEKARRAELISLGWRPDSDVEGGEATDAISGWVPGQANRQP